MLALALTKGGASRLPETQEIPMAFNMKNRSLLSLVHHTQRELHYLLDLSRDLKRAKYTGTEEPHLKGKNIALAAGLVAYQG